MRVSLQPLSYKYLDGYVELLSDLSTARYISDVGPLSRDQAKDKMESINSNGNNQQYFAITSEIDDMFLGYIAAHDLSSSVCPISYAILPKYRRRGVASTAIRKIQNYIFEKEGIESIEALTHVGNEGSKELLRSLDFDHIGTADTAKGKREKFKKSNSNKSVLTTS